MDCNVAIAGIIFGGIALCFGIVCFAVYMTNRLPNYPYAIPLEETEEE